MMQYLLFAGFALLLATLAGCGVDGPPTRPAPGLSSDTPPPGVHVSGEARIGVVSAL